MSKAEVCGSPIGMWSSVICAFISGTIALYYLQRAQRLFTAMALLAFTWALVVIYWRTCDDSIQASIGVYTSFLTVYIGGLLAGHAHWIRGSDSPPRVDRFQRWSIYLLFVVMFERTLHEFTWPFFTLNSIQVAEIVEVVLGTIGFIAIALGVLALGGRIAFSVLLVIFTAYTVVTALWGLRHFSEFGNIAKYHALLWPPEYYPHCFTILKILFTIVFGGIIAYIGMEPDRRKTGVWRSVGWVVHPQKPPVTTP